MKYRPLPAPPRPPREKRIRGVHRDPDQPLDGDDSFDDRDGGGERIASSSTADSYDQSEFLEEVEASTQTDPLPDDFVCEEFEITPDMKIIEPRRPAKTMVELLNDESPKTSENLDELLTEDVQLARGLQRFRDANQRSLSERSRVSSHSLSRPHTPSSAVIIERRISSPVPPNEQEGGETALTASLIVRPIDDLELEEEELRREGLLTDSSQHSKSDFDSHPEDEEREESIKLLQSDYSASVDLEAAVDNLLSETEPESEIESTVEKDIQEESETERKLRDSDYYEKESGDEQLSSSYDERDVTMISKVDVQAELERIRREEEEDIQKLQHEIDMLLQNSEEHSLTIREPKKESEEERKWAEYEARMIQEISNSERNAVTVKAISEISKQQESEPTADLKEEESAVPPPQPPPRRKSAANIELPGEENVAVQQTVTKNEVISQPQNLVQNQFPTHITDLEVERLRVHALQAGQIMVGQFHGSQVSADELECKSGNLVVRNLELPPGFIEDIVGRVRNTERAQLLSSETQTSEHTSQELLPTTEIELEAPIRRTAIPPPKPPRQRDYSATSVTTNETPAHINLDEETQTETASTAPAMVPVFPTIEYLQSLAPLAFYNLDRQSAGITDDGRKGREHHHHRAHHHYHRCESSGSEPEDTQDADSGREMDTTIRRRQRTCSSHASTSTQATAEAQSVGQASRQFVSACSMSLVKTINQLTSSLDSEKVDAMELTSVIRPQQRSQMILLLAVLAFAFFLFMLSGRNVHTHHWDYFNPPGNEGRPS